MMSLEILYIRNKYTCDVTDNHLNVQFVVVLSCSITKDAMPQMSRLKVDALLPLQIILVL